MQATRVRGAIGAAALVPCAILGLTAPARATPFVYATSSAQVSQYVTEQDREAVAQYDVGSSGGLVLKSEPFVPAGAGVFRLAVGPGPPAPTSKDQCKNGGRRAYGDRFKNQGQCVAFVTRGPKP